tara:strand:- start:793 stop:987 length:195 start_codon:yes stop_codon:yes gene_type:complete
MEKKSEYAWMNITRIETEEKYIKELYDDIEILRDINSRYMEENQILKDKIKKMKENSSKKCILF